MAVVVTAPAPLRTKGGCRTRVDGVRCGHGEHQHRDVGFEGWRVQCAGCGCTAYRDPWPRAAVTVLLGAVVASAGIWWLGLTLFAWWIGASW